jgi:hypothetical protein
MKNKILLKLFFACVLQAAVALGAFAADSANYDALIKNALDKLVEGRTAPLEVVITPVTIGDTESVAELGAYLDEKIRLYAANNKMYKIAAQEPAALVKSDSTGRGIKLGEIKKAELGGSYTISGGAVNVTLRLSAPQAPAQALASSSFKIALSDLKSASITALPANIATEGAANAKDSMLRSLAAYPSQSEEDFTLVLWGTSDTRIFYEGDALNLNLMSGVDCYFKIYLIDVNNNVSMLYPNKIDSDNRLRANVRRRIPEKSEFILSEPYGEETIIAVASVTQFPNIKEQMPDIKLNKSSSNAVSDAMDITPNTVSAIYKYTILKKSAIKETYTYTKPDNFSEYLDLLRAEAAVQGRKFSGDEKEGSFTKIDGGGTELTGMYKVSGNKINVTIFLDSPVYSSRGRGGAYDFSFPKPPDLSGAISKIRHEIEKNNGNFSGDENEGSFTASGIAGNYSVLDHVMVSIFKKPAIVPNSLIEKEVKKYFGVK